MKTTQLFILLFIALFSGCQYVNDKSSDFYDISTDSLTILPEKDAYAETIIVSDNVKDKVSASEIIEDFYYLPLETTDESLFGYSTELAFYDNKIYVFDYFTTNRLTIFDKNGYFLKSLGNKGGAEFEFLLPVSFAIDKIKKQIVIYDNQKRKWMSFTPDGDYIQSRNVNFRMAGSFQILPNGEYVSSLHKGNKNVHLGKYADYKLLYTDTVGRIVKAAYNFPESECTMVIDESLSWLNDELLYYPLYHNKIYTVNDSVVNLRYKFDYSDFTPIDEYKLSTFEKYEDFKEYLSSHTYMNSFTENNTHLCFLTYDKNGNRFISFYDKRSKKILSFSFLYFDTDFAFEYENGVYAYGDYFVALLQPATLKALQKHIETTTHYAAKPENKQLFAELKDDDNMVLVFFKIKTL